MQLAIEKNEGAHSHSFQTGLLQFSCTKIRGVCEFDHGSRGHCLQYTYIYMTKTGQKSLMIQNEQVLLNNSV